MSNTKGEEFPREALHLYVRQADKRKWKLKQRNYNPNKACLFMMHFELHGIFYNIYCSCYYEVLFSHKYDCGIVTMWFSIL